MIGATADGAAIPGIDNIESDRRIDADSGMECGRRLPGPVADTANIFLFDARRDQRNAQAVAQQYISGAVEAFEFDLYFSREEST